MAAKTPEAKAIEKQTKTAEKNARRAALVERAKSVVMCAEKRNGLIIIDDDAKGLLEIAVNKYDGNERNSVTVDNSDVPPHIIHTLIFEAEKLHQYGLVSSYMNLGGSVMLTLSSNGKDYLAKLNDIDDAEVSYMRNEVFISHRETDKEYAEMIQDFFVGCGVPKELVFCSSLPGNDVDEQIPKEVKAHLEHSAVNVMILSKDYYDSSYCMNEMGIIWFTEDDASVIPIGLSDVDHSDMIGFINSNYILRRIDKNTDLSHILDIVQNKLSLERASHTTVVNEINKLQSKYVEAVKSFPIEDSVSGTSHDAETILSNEAALLMIFASIANARIMKIDVMGGTLIGVEGFQFTNGSDARNKAFWLDALEELSNNHFIRAVGSKQEFFELTRTGYEMVDSIKETELYQVIHNNPKAYYDENIKGQF